MWLFTVASVSLRIGHKNVQILGQRSYWLAQQRGTQSDTQPDTQSVSQSVSQHSIRTGWLKTTETLLVRAGVGYGG